MSDRPFRVLGLQQVAIGALDRGALRHLWVDLLGLAVERSHRIDTENVEEDVAFLGSGASAVELDLMQPIDPARSPRVHRPALHHLGLWVDDLPAAVRWLSERGVRFAGAIRAGASGHDVAFIHPRGDDRSPQGGEGVLIELVQAPPEVGGR